MTDNITPADVRAYRVNLICSCQNDIAYGYGPNEAAARVAAEVEFRRAHGSRAKYTQVVVEKATADGSHYETARVALRYDFTDGLGSELDAIAVETGLGSWWAEAFHHDYARPKHPYYFESSYSPAGLALEAALSRVARGAHVNRLMRKAAKEARDKVRALRRVIWPHLEPAGDQD